MKNAITVSVCALFAVLLTQCAAQPKMVRNEAEKPEYKPIAGFDQETNQALAVFFEKHEHEQGRKIAVFDGDGTVLGQTPHYLADECLYQYARKHPERKADLIADMKTQSNVSIPYVQNRVRYFAGLPLQFWRDEGERCFHELYSDKIFTPMQMLIKQLQAFGFEVWIVTASPESLYQQFLHQAFDIPITHVVGVKSVIDKGLITETMVQPIPQDHGKKQAIETFVQDRPLLVAGNSRGDKEMIEFSQDLKMIVNPDEHVAADQQISIADYAKKEGWLRVRISDMPRPDFPAVSSKFYNIRLNTPHPAK